MKFTIMGLAKGTEKQERGFGGSGNWDLYKCFIGGGEGYGEFYINLNLKDGMGEIKMKDVNYAKNLIDSFSTEMLGDTSEAFWDAVDRAVDEEKDQKAMQDVETEINHELDSDARFEGEKEQAELEGREIKHKD